MKDSPLEALLSVTAAVAAVAVGPEISVVASCPSSWVPSTARIPTSWSVATRRRTWSKPTLFCIPALPLPIQPLKSLDVACQTPKVRGPTHPCFQIVWPERVLYEKSLIRQHQLHISLCFYSVCIASRVQFFEGSLTIVWKTPALQNFFVWFICFTKLVLLCFCLDNYCQEKKIVSHFWRIYQIRLADITTSKRRMHGLELFRTSHSVRKAKWTLFTQWPNQKSSMINLANYTYGPLTDFCLNFQTVVLT